PGIALFLCAALMLYVETRKSLPRALGWLILAGNVVWVIGSIAVLFVTSPSSSTAACAGPPAEALLRGVEPRQPARARDHALDVLAEQVAAALQRHGRFAHSLHVLVPPAVTLDRKSTRLNSSH